jgi:hypothetical protein
MEVGLFDTGPKKKDKRVINPLAPIWPFRMLAIGPSGSGKTNAIIHMLENYMDFDSLQVYARHLDNEQYTKWKEMMDEREIKNGGNWTFWRSDLDETVPLESLPDKWRNMIVFDDMITLPPDKLAYVVDCYIRGRHKNASTIFQTQTWTTVPKDIRRNLSWVLMFKGLSKRDVREIWNQVGGELEFEDFWKLYQECIAEPYGFMVVDLATNLKPLRYRNKWDGLYVPKKK